jgi:hypothetical protein
LTLRRGQPTSIVPAGEPKDAFVWAFKMFRRHLGPPTVMFTDGDPGMAGAIQIVFGGDSTTHLLCIYHIFTNLFKHMHRYRSY